VTLERECDWVEQLDAWVDFGAITCDWCGSRYPTQSMVEIGDIDWTTRAWPRPSFANLDLCLNCYTAMGTT